MNTLLFVIIAAGAVALLIVMKNVKSKGVLNVNVEKAVQIHNENKAIILDVRTENEFAQGHLKNARNIPVQQLSEKVSELSSWKDNSMLVYCHSGARSTAACFLLKKNGFTKLNNMSGGISAWIAAGNNVEN